MRDDLSNGWVFFVSVDDAYVGKEHPNADKYGFAKMPYVVITSKAYWEENGYVYDQHIEEEVRDLLPDIIGGEAMEATFETSLEDPEKVRLAMLNAGFEEIPNKWGVE